MDNNTTLFLFAGAAIAIYVAYKKPFKPVSAPRKARRPYADPAQFLGRGEMANTEYKSHKQDYGNQLGVKQQLWELNNGTQVIHYGDKEKKLKK